MPVDSLRALLAHSMIMRNVPPCSLALDPALRNQTEYVALRMHGCLGRSSPTEHFDATKQLLSQFDAQHPLRVAALGLEDCERGCFFLKRSMMRMRLFARYRDITSI
jgi:hypothetical protein